MFFAQMNRIGLTRPAILVFSAVMAWLVARSALHLGAWYYVLYNADSLYIASFFDDLIHQRAHLSGWRFSPAPNFFPDMAIYAAARLGGAGFRTTAIFCAFLQTALFLESCRSLAATARLRGEAALTGAVMVLLILCFWQFFHRADAFPKTNDIYWLSSLAILGNHFGVILASLWGLALAGGALQSGLRGAIARGAALAALILVTGCSDMLYLIWFCAPAIFCLLCASGFARGVRLRSAALALLVAAAGGLVYALQLAFNPLIDRYHDDSADVWQTAVQSFDFARSFLFESGRGNALHAAIFGTLAMVLVLLGLIRLAVAFRRRDAVASSHVRTLIVGFLAASPAACLVGGCLTGMFHDLGLPRYTAPVVFLTMVALGFLFAEAVEGREIRLPGWVRPAFLAGFVPLLCLFLATRHYAERLPPPPELSCLPADRPLNGLAEYWQARPVTLFGDGRLQVEPLTVDAVPFWWISNRFWFTHRWTEPDAMPLYSFIDMRRLDPATIERRYGKPSSIVTCKSGDIWFYDDAEQLTRRFLELYEQSAEGLGNPG